MVILLVISILVSSTCLIVSLLKSGLLQRNTQSQPSSLVCVKSELVTQQSSAQLSKLHRRVNNGQETLCARNSTEASALLDLIFARKGTYVVKETSSSRPSPGNVTSRRVSAHKRLMPSVQHSPLPATVPQFSNNNNVALLVNSETDGDPSTEHALNVGVLSSGLHVLHSGMYYVYSSVFFISKGDRPCKEYASQSWHHNVLRVRPNDRQSSDAILRSLHTCCDDCARDRETSYAGAAFYLEAGDHLSVEVSWDGLVRFDKQSSYLGLYMLGANN